MKYFVVQYKTKISGKFDTTYHQGIRVSRNKSIINTYVEQITTNASKARKFFDEKEAGKVGQLFCKSEFHTFKIIEL